MGGRKAREKTLVESGNLVNPVGVRYSHAIRRLIEGRGHGLVFNAL